MQNNRLDDYMKNMRRCTPWMVVTWITAVSFILLTLYRMYKTKVATDEPVVFTVLMVALIISVRYIVMLFAQAALKNNQGKTANEKLEKYFARSFVFWLAEGIIYLIFVLLFLLMVMDAYHFI